MFDCIQYLESMINDYEANTYFKFNGNTYVIRSATNINLYHCYKSVNLVYVVNLDLV